MTKNDFLGICTECEVDPNLVVEVDEVVDLLKADLLIPKIENQLADDSLHTAVDSVMQTLGEFLPKDDSPNRGHTHMVDLACVYEVDECPQT